MRNQSQSKRSSGMPSKVRKGSTSFRASSCQSNGISAAAAQKYPKKGVTERLLTGGIVAATVAMSTSLFVYFKPFTLDDVANKAKGAYSYVTNYVDHLQEKRQRRIAEEKASREAEEAPEEAKLMLGETIPYMDSYDTLGNVADFDSEPVFIPQEDSIYSYMLNTSMGPMLYYCQGDIRWKDYLYGGEDPISRYGCGPVCVAMVINSFSSTSVTPIDMADWAAANGGYARHGGSYHGLIPKSISAFGLHVESVSDRSAQNAAELLRTGHILVALMGRGSLTQNGHFIIIAQLCANGNVYIADPASYENCTKEWDLQLLMNELKDAYDDGAPLWAVSLP